MKNIAQNWIKPAVALVLISIITFLAPAAPLDPWKLLSPKKIATMILALTAIQSFGSAMKQYLGTRTGSILTGFFGGLISSTATTASLAKSSKISANQHSGEILIFLTATGAMLFEGLALVIAGMTEVHYSNMLIFIGPILTTIVMVILQYRKHKELSSISTTSSFQILPILKLSIFVVVILSVSKICQNLLGQDGLLVFTSFVSLFEIHGSVIANVQLHESGVVTVNFLCSLLAVSVVASYLSKLFLIATLGSAVLRSHAIKYTLVLFLSLAISWAIAVKL